MTTFMRSAAVATVSLFVAFLTVGCDDVGGGGGGGGPTTTIATITTTTVSTTTSSTLGGGTTTTTPGGTTTTTLGGPRVCVVTWAVTNAVSIGALQYDTDYSGAPGGFNGAADTVECDDLTGSLASFNDNETTQVLSAGLISIAGFNGARDIVTCNFTVDTGSPDPVAGDFPITVVDATDPQLNPITVNMTISNIACSGGGGGTTTVPGGTTTTVGGTTTTTVGGGGNAFTIGFDLVDAVNIGALQFSVDYSGAPGGFDGAADTVSCSDKTGSLASFNDNEATSALSAGLINLGGFTGPLQVVTCAFTSTGTAPVPADFVLTVEDAAQPDLTPILPLPTINVTVTAG